MITDSRLTVGIIGAGTMGSGIAQIAALAGHNVVIYDTDLKVLEKAEVSMISAINKLKEKGKIDSITSVLKAITFSNKMDLLKRCGLIIEAIIEQLSIKREVFAKLDQIVNLGCILATNTSSFSITSIASACQKPERVIGLHFFNPAPVMKLVEIIPGLQTNNELIGFAKELLENWGKTIVVTKDTPGFIVNRLARPYYGEAIKIYEEGIADMATIDWAMTQPSLGGFKMGPFALMDFIGLDVNYAVTESVFQSFYYEPRFRPSFTQKRLVEAGWLGRKTGKGFYNYDNDNNLPLPDKDLDLGKQIFERILSMLINEAVDAYYLNLANATDLDTAIMLGANYPKGLLKWCDEFGAQKCLNILDELYNQYHDTRYRASIMLRKYAFENKKFFL